MNEKKCFEIFTKFNDDKYELYNAVKELIQEEIINARGMENAKFYDVLLKLSKSAKSSVMQDIVDKSMCDIAEDYNDYLP